MVMKTYFYSLLIALSCFVVACGNDKDEPEVTGGEAMAGEAMGGEAMGGEAPGGEAPGGEAPGGEAPGGEAPGGEEVTEISAQEFADLLTSIDGSVFAALDAYCEAHCADVESEICADEREIEVFPLEQAECILENSSVEELSAVVLSASCVAEVTASIAECILELTSCDEDALNACWALESNIMDCTQIDEEYEARVDGVCLPMDAE
jgi:hypothetical protein